MRERDQSREDPKDCRRRENDPIFGSFCSSPEGQRNVRDDLDCKKAIDLRAKCISAALGLTAIRTWLRAILSA